MQKKIGVFFYLIFTCFVLSISAKEKGDSTIPLYHSSQLSDVIQTIQKLPEAQKLIARIQKEGNIRILCNQQVAVCEQFGACWDPINRIIFVDYSPRHSKGALIGSILFELQNAAVSSQLLYYDQLATQGKIEQENYVKAVEYLEYKNSLKASKLAEKGIVLGLFPWNAKLPTFSSFEEHYQIQKEGGHSAYIANNYRHLIAKTRIFKY